MERRGNKSNGLEDPVSSQKEAKRRMGKPIYEKPLMLNLGDIPRGLGQSCNIGSAAQASCVMGTLPKANCVTGTLYM
jgi:hypothetical protein